MGSYMCAYGYGCLFLAKSLLREHDDSLVWCRECSRCAVSCPPGFEMPAKIPDIIRVLDILDKLLR